MAEALIRVTDSGNGMPVGGVVSICEDGHAWTPTEIANTSTFWRIVRVDLSVAQAESLIATITVVLQGVPALKKRQIRLAANAVTFLLALGPGVNVLNASQRQLIKGAIELIDWGV